MDVQGFDAMAVVSILLNLENLQENQQQSARQEEILKQLDIRMERLEKLIKELEK